MAEIRAFRPEDAAALVLQPAQAEQAKAVPHWREGMIAAAKIGPAWTAVDGDRVLGVAGLIEPWSGRLQCWCYIGADVPKAAWVVIHRAVRSRLAEAKARRIEAEVRAGWVPGERWVRLLGFEPEGLMRGYAPDGTDYGRWAMVRA